MEPLLFLAHRIPYPPTKGDKIRSFNVLKWLAERYAVFLGAYVDDPHDWRHADELEALCEEVCLVPLSRRRAMGRAVGGLAKGQALTLPYYRDARMKRWVEDVRSRKRPAKTFVFSSSMAQYVTDDLAGTVVDFVDVDSDKWRQYAERHRWPWSWLYRRESDRLSAYERYIAARAKATVLVSNEEIALLEDEGKPLGASLYAVPNGVDTEYFSPHRSYENPYPAGGPVAAFTGAMDYWANVDAVTWFVDVVWPLVRNEMPDARFFIVGARPTDAVVRLQERAGVTVTGAVRDIRPYLAHAAVAVAPLRVARGIQNKVLEAGAMARPVVATPAAMEGLDAETVAAELVADDATSFAQAVARCLADAEASELGRAARAAVAARYSWETHLQCLGKLLEAAPSTMPTDGGRVAAARPATKAIGH